MAATPTRKARRARRSRLQRILRGSMQLNKYALPGVLVVLAGCVGTPSFIAITPDGKHAVVFFNDQGPALASMINGMPLIIDLETGLAKPAIDVDLATINNGKGIEAGMWFDAAGDSIAFVVDKGSVLIRNGKITDLPGHSFPRLTPDGMTLFTTVADEEIELKQTVEQAAGRLYATDIKTGTSRDLGLRGIPSGVSPDGKHLAFVSAEMKDGEPVGEWGVYVVPVVGGEAKRLAGFNPDYAWYFRPCWIDNDTLVYRGFPEGENRDADETDTDLYMTTLAGQTRRLTSDNDDTEAYPQPTTGGRLVWIEVRGRLLGSADRPDFEKLGGRLKLAEPNAGGQGMKVTDLGYTAWSFTVQGDTLLFVDYDMEKRDAARNTLWKLDLSKPDQPAVNLSDNIIKNTKGIPRASDPG